jgi:catechol 2,3-dioxygenase-like lactoylglutathione lyase family enzyme
MFEKLMATAVLPASDLPRARQWWRDVLAREPVFEDAEGEALYYDVGGTMVLVYRSAFAGTGKSTAFGIVTDDLDRDMTGLRTHGVVFHDYDMPGLTTVDGVAQLGEGRGAWFSDSEGNIFSIAEASPQQREMMTKLRAESMG